MSRAAINAGKIVRQFANENIILVPYLVGQLILVNYRL